MSQRTIQKNFNSFRGRDIRSSDLVRANDLAIEFRNARVVREDSCVKREGGKIRGANAQFTGLYTYRWSDLETGETLEEKVSLSDNLYKENPATFTVSYGGASNSVFINIQLDVDEGVFYCTVLQNSVEVLTFDLGTGLEASPIELGDLEAAIEGISADYTVTISGDSTIPAAFLPVTIYGDLATDDQVLEVADWTQMSTLASDPFSDYFDNRGIDSWELASCVNASNCLYIGTGYEYLHKYDGQNVYRAGLPFPDTAPSASLGGTGFTDTNIRYIYLYKQVDNRGNVTYGVESDPSAQYSPSDDTATVRLENILAAEGFNTGCAIVNGAQAGVVTITVDAAHTFKVGDTAYFYDGSSSAYVERLITATGATTITVDGSAVNVADNAVISNNLRIAIYRSTAGGDNFYLVAEIPNNSFSATQTYDDAKLTADLGEQYFSPVKERDLLDGVFPRYLCMHQDLLIASGDPGTPNTWYFSSPEGVEYFPAETNYEDVRNTSGGGIRGIGSDQEHMILGTDNSLFVVTGDLGTGVYRQEKLAERNVGMACHNSIVDIGGRIIFLSQTGFWSIEGGYNLTEIGAPINSVFRTNGISASQLPQFKRAFAVHFEETEEYICFVPCESGTGTAKYVNNSSVAHVFDTFHESWAEWTGLNMGGGLAICDNNLIWQSKRDDGGVTGNLWERHRLAAADDYADHDQPIDFILGSQWIDSEEPTVFKVYLWFKAYNLLREVLSATFILSVSVERNLQRGLPWFSFQLDFGSGQSGQGWGYFPWGGGVWGTPQPESQKMKLRSGKAQSLRFVMRNNVLHEKVAISAWEVTLTAPMAVETKD